MQNAPYTVVTGASSGIGYELAKAFAMRGDNMIVAARRADKLDELKREILSLAPDADVVIREVDLASNDAAIAFYESLSEYHITTCVNNAGRGNKGDITAADLETDLNMLHINMDAVAILSSLYVRDYKDVDGATLVNVSSIGGYLLVPGATLYCASKFFVSALTEGIHHEMVANGHALRAKVMAPTTTASGFEQVANDLEDEVDYAATERPFHTAAEMAGFIIELAESDKVLGEIDFATRSLKLSDPRYPHL